MKFVALFLVLSLVILMAEPGDCSLKSFWGRVKAAFKGAKDSWRGKSCLIIYQKEMQNQQDQPNQPPN
uniref:Uncharacterized protein n=1 Tax=Fundulus heteroclitus TaxID=8078 RepID=A0A3Q2QNF8_FUNHE